MNRRAYWEIEKLASTPEAREKTIAYLTEHLRHFFRKQEHVLICFLEHKEGSISWLMEQAVLRCGAVPVVWGPDHRWKTLLQQAFFCKTTAIIGSPLIVLGLTKLKRNSGTPLYIRRVITAGYPCMDWMIDGIVRGFDCEMGGCFSLGESGVVAGFACGHSWGVHLREEEYGVEIVDEMGNVLEDGQTGEILLYPKARPELRYLTGDTGRMVKQACKCGSPSPRLMQMRPRNKFDPELMEFCEHLQSWTSVLDTRVARGPSGLEIELVCFPGEKLPKLPPSALRIIRPWNPKSDEPFPYNPTLENAEK